MGKDINLIDSAKQVAIEVKKILATENMFNGRHKGRHKFYVSDEPEWFVSLARRFLGEPVRDINKISPV